MPARKRKSTDDGVVPPPTRRSTRTRNPSKPAAEAEKPTNASAASPPAAQDETIVHRFKEPAEVATVTSDTAIPTTNGNDRVDGASGENATGATTPKAAAATAAADKHDMDSEDKIAAHPGSPKPASQTPIKTQTYAAKPADCEVDELVAEQPAVKVVKISDGARKGRSKYDKPEEMLTNYRSPLVDARLRDILCSAKAWELLSVDERKRVLAKFPDQQEILDADTEEARPDVASLKNNDNFRHDVARYQDNLGKGKHDPEWIQQAQDAHRKREIGMYDDYLATHFEEDWGIKPLGHLENGSKDAEPKITAEAGAAVGAGEDNSQKPNDDIQQAENSIEVAAEPAGDAVVAHQPTDNEIQKAKEEDSAAPIPTEAVADPGLKLAEEAGEALGGSQEAPPGDEKPPISEGIMGGMEQP